MNRDFIVTKISRVIFVGKNEYSEDITSFTHVLKHNELILHLSGRTDVCFNGKNLCCEKDIIRFLPKGESSGYTVNRIERGECIDIFFDTDIPVSKEAFLLKVKNSPVVTNLFKKIFSLWVSKNEGYYFKCISLLYEIFSELQKQNYIPENQYTAIKPAIRYIHDNFLDEKISVPYLAELCQISESYLKKLFIKKFGISPVKYMIGLKINYACDLLRSELYTIAQTAEICGYSNGHFFSRQFKEYMGVSPSAFVEKYKSSK